MDIYTAQNYLENKFNKPVNLLVAITILGQYDIKSATIEQIEEEENQLAFCMGWTNPLWE